MSPSSLPDPWRSFLEELNAAATRDVELHCLGGFVVAMYYGLARPTADVDVVLIAPRDQAKSLLDLGREGSPLHHKYKVYLDYVTIATVAENYRERLVEMFPAAFSKLRLFALDPYDLSLAKLERNLQRDRDDVKYLARTIPLDPRVLEIRYEQELRPYLANPQREDLTLRLWVEMINEERRSSL